MTARSEVNERKVWHDKVLKVWRYEDNHEIIEQKDVIADKEGFTVAMVNAQAERIKQLEEQLNQKEDFANVIGCLQEKKMAWIGKQKIYIRDEKALKETAKDYQTRRLFLIELINLSETAINDLEEIINQNFA